MIFNYSFNQIQRYFSNYEREKRRIRGIPRYKAGKTNLLGIEIQFVDSISFLHGIKEIFEEECYKFQTKKPSPFIIDCGSNIGLSVIYFKKLFPNSKIIGFEPDPNIYRILKENIVSNNFDEIELVNKAIWNTDSETYFRIEGGFSGRIPLREDTKSRTLIETTRLSHHMKENIDLLKLDIEGAEIEVLFEIEDKLKLVERIFIEYHSPLREKQKLHKLIHVLNRNNFRYYIKEAFVPSKPFISINDLDGMDLQLNIYGVRK
jgi:FkbM family methyltransferase